MLRKRQPKLPMSLLFSRVIVSCVLDMFLWLRATLASSSAVCGTINPAEKSAKPKKEDAHTHTHKRTIQENLTTVQE